LTETEQTRREPAVVVNGAEYEMPTGITIGESRAIFRATGLRLSTWDDLDTDNPDHLAAMVYLVMHRADETVTFDAIDRLELLELSFISGNDEDAEDDENGPPRDAADVAAATGHSPAGEPNQATSPASSGTPSSYAPTTSSPPTSPT